MSPSESEMGEIVLKIKERIFRSLEKKEWITEYDLNFDMDDLHEKSPLLS